MLDTLLADGLKQLGLTFDTETQAALRRYVDLLGRWNRTYNLTAVRDPVEMVTRHLLDSLAIAPFVHGPRVIDVGTGAGLPGIPLALAHPALAFVLLDANAKKTRFLVEVQGQLKLRHVEVVQARVEAYRPEQPFDTVLSRAFASIADMLKTAGHLCRPGGQLLAMKGTYPAEELAEMPAEYRLVRTEALRVPGLDAERHLVIITPR